MCEFCKKENDGNRVDLTSVTCDFGITNLDVDLIMYSGCDIEPELDILVTVGNEVVTSAELGINYCPMCGKDLRSERE